MDAKRKGEIAYELLKITLRQKEMRMSKNVQREFGNIAKETGIPVGEVAEFIEIVTREMVDEMFDKPISEK